MDETLLREIIIFFAVLVASVVVLLMVRRFALGALGRVTKRTETKLDDALMRTLKPPSFWWAVAIGFYVALGTSTLPPRFVDYGLKGIYVVIVVSITFVVAGIASTLFQRAIEKSAANVPSTGLSRAIINAVILALGFLIILNGLGISITPLLTALGVGGLAVALALQDTLSNLFAGVHILVERPLKVGDYVKLDSGEEGYVTDIGWRTTKIRKLQNNLVIIPNSKLSQSVITNFNMPEKRMSVLIPIGVSYDSDPQNIEDILLDEATKAAGEIKGLLKEPVPFVRFSPGFGDSSLDFTLICQVSEFVDQYLVQHELRKRIFNRFKAEGVEIPFPIRTVYLKKD